METETLLILTSACVALLLLRPAACIMLYPLLGLEGIYHKEKRKGFHMLFPLKIMAAPMVLINRMTSGGASRYLLYHIGLIPWMCIRKSLYRGLGAKISRSARVHFRTEIRAPWFLEICDGAIVGDNAILDARNGLKIDTNVNISSNVSIYTEQHDHRDPFFGCGKSEGKAVIISSRAWLGSNVVILPHVRVGEGAVCCAGSVVTKNVADYDIVAGIPAKTIGQRTHNLKYQFDCLPFLLM